MDLIFIILGMTNLLIGIGFIGKQINSAGSLKEWSNDGFKVCYVLFIVMTTLLIWSLPFYVL